MTLEELLKLKAKLLDQMKAILDTADGEGRPITEDEETLYNDLETQFVQAEADITNAEAAESARTQRRVDLDARIEASSRIVTPTPIRPATYHAEDEREFSNIGEFMAAVRFNPMDSRLQDSFDSGAGNMTAEQSMGVGQEGGFAVPTQFRETLLSVTPDQAIFRPRSMVIPAGSPPDSEVTMPALDQTQQENMYGGVEVSWIGEGAAKPETDLKLREVTLTPHEVAGILYTTDKLLRNWGAASAVIERQLRLAVIAAEETKFYSGNGVASPLGITQSSATIEYTRATASQISYADVLGMFARLKMGGSGVWIASQTTIPQLGIIQDAAGNYIFVQSAVTGVPASLMGMPILFHDRSVGLGTKGDLVLVDLSYYLIKDGSGPFVQSSEHFKFNENKTAIKVFWNVDGQPWLTEPLPLEGSTTNTVSPFVVLK